VPSVVVSGAAGAEYMAAVVHPDRGEVVAAEGSLVAHKDSARVLQVAQEYRDQEDRKVKTLDGCSLVENQAKIGMFPLSGWKRKRLCRTRGNFLLQGGVLCHKNYIALQISPGEYIISL
jgi:hypothetical protein